MPKGHYIRKTQLERTDSQIIDWEQRWLELNLRLDAAEKRLREYDEAALQGRFPLQRL
jgi:hypothetical protein